MWYVIALSLIEIVERNDQERAVARSIHHPLDIFDRGLHNRAIDDILPLLYVITLPYLAYKTEHEHQLQVSGNPERCSKP